MKINTQPSEKNQEVRALGALDVHSIFDTIQGEGPYAGEPSTFIRLAGCNLACQACDTEYTQNRRVMTPKEIGQEISKLPKRSVMVLTGGEPFRQDFFDLFLNYVYPGTYFQVETNGTVYRDFLKKPYAEQIDIVCSPKTPLIDSRMWEHIFCLKYVVKDGEVDTDGLPLKSVGLQYGRPARPPKNWIGKIYVQPLDEQDPEKNALNLEAAVKSCMEHGYCLTVQIHKQANLP